MGGGGKENNVLYLPKLGNGTDDIFLLPQKVEEAPDSDFLSLAEKSY